MLQQRNGYPPAVGASAGRLKRKKTLSLFV